MEFRFAAEQDVPLILRMIRALADYEGLLGEVVATEDILREELFVRRHAEVLFAVEAGREVGFALFFHNFSTFLGRSGIYLEDLYVEPQARGRGVGKAMLEKLAAIAVERGCGRLEWWCLDANEPSVAFYRHMGAQAMSDWTVYRIAGERLRELGAHAE